MSHRHRRSGISLGFTQDPGKDLFAYLFLMIMVFSFMLLMSTEEKHNSMIGQEGPVQDSVSGRSSLAAVANEKIGRLVKENGEIFLVFGKNRYKPGIDLDRLEKDNQILLITAEDGKEHRMIYLLEDKGNDVLLTEYLEAFQKLSWRGIGVAFAERVK